LTQTGQRSDGVSGAAIQGIHLDEYPPGLDWAWHLRREPRKVDIRLVKKECKLP
jgi:hypothetical protein